jgi:hypothetical protein
MVHSRIEGLIAERATQTKYHVREIVVTSEQSAISIEQADDLHTNFPLCFV